MQTTTMVGVAGLGLLGRGIVACLLANGMRVVGYARSQQSRDEARAYIQSAIEQLVARAGFPKDLSAQWPERYVEAKDVSEFAPCEFVIESIFEDLDAKRELFDQLEAVVGSSVPIASNTSALPISTLQNGRKNPNRFIGTHWAEPCHITRFLEVIRGDQTDDATANAAMDLARRAGKDPSLVQKDVEGFIVNRLGYAMYREAFWLLENGVADVATIDRAYQNAASVWVNIAGPFRWMDLSGIPAYAAVMKRLWPKLSTAKEVPALMQQLIDEGAKGISNGRGFYRYTPEEAEAWEKKLVENVWKVRELQKAAESGEQA